MTAKELLLHCQRGHITYDRLPAVAVLASRVEATLALHASVDGKNGFCPAPCATVRTLNGESR